MKLEGEFVFKAPRETVWEILLDPEVLKKHMPGCESLEPTKKDHYKAVLSIGVASIKGRYNADLGIKNKKAPKSYTLTVDGSGKPGFVKGEGSVHLEEQDGNTLLRYEGDLQIGGLIARVGQRLIGTIADKMTRQFFSELGKEAEKRK